ncbi:MAG: hypothetical protein KDA41_21205, partial [Planctomycetales bacterium]|nr:hypothetical protein [Planctomycetales bacterium]
ADLSLLASGPAASVETYTITALTDLTAITGFRIEMLDDPSLPSGGPGRASNGNFVLLEFAVSHQALIPEPGSVALWSLVSLAVGAFVWRQKRRGAARG